MYKILDNPALWTIIMLLGVMFKLAYDYKELNTYHNQILYTSEIVPYARDYIYVTGELERKRWNAVCTH